MLNYLYLEVKVKMIKFLCKSYSFVSYLEIRGSLYSTPDFYISFEIKESESVTCRVLSST